MNYPLLDAEYWLGSLLDCAVKGLLILAVAFLAERILRRRSAALRHAVWAAAVVAVLAMPLASVLVPAWSVPGVPGKASLLAAPVSGWAFHVSGELASMAVSAGPAQESPGGVARVLLWLWMAGAGAGVLSLLAGAARLARLASRSEPVLIPRWMHLCADLSKNLGLRRPVRLLRCERPVMPLTWGALNPRVLLPRDSETWSEERIRAVLAHELAHIRRQDWLVQMLAEVGRALYWFNPLIWSGCARLRRESEYACDDRVLNCGIPAPDYADHLLALARSLKSSEWAWRPSLAVARPSNLERRFIAMFDSAVNRQVVSRKVAVLTVLAASCLLVPLAALQAPAQNVSGKFAGTIYDPSGGVIPNATVIMSNPKANTRDMTTTGEAGWFEFEGLPAGTYTLEVLKPGFARFRLPEVSLAAGQSYERKLTLDLGKTSETVDVVAEGTPKSAHEPASSGPPHRVRVGGSVASSKIVKMVRPVYPTNAKGAGIEGSVLLEAVVGIDGKLLSLKVLNSKIDPDLAKAAVEAVSQWQYQPTLLNGNPVEVVTEITVNFTLAK